MTKRKRARQQPRLDSQTGDTDEPKKRPVTDEMIAKAYAHCENVLVPQVFTDIARRLGSRNVRPADFRCQCETSYLDGLPLCEGKKPNCRYADRAGDGMRAEHLAEKHKPRYDVALRAAMAACERMPRPDLRSEGQPPNAPRRPK